MLLSRHRGSRTSGSCRLVKNLPFFRSASPASNIHQRNVRERWRGCGKMRRMGLGKMGNFVPNCPIFLLFFSHFQPISHIFSTFPRNFQEFFFWQFHTIPIFANFPPFPLILPHSLHSPQFSPILPPVSPIYPHSPPVFPHFGTMFPIFPSPCGQSANAAATGAGACAVRVPSHCHTTGGWGFSNSTAFLRGRGV